MGFSAALTSDCHTLQLLIRDFVIWNYCVWSPFTKFFCQKSIMWRMHEQCCCAEELWLLLIPLCSSCSLSEASVVSVNISDFLSWCNHFKVMQPQQKRVMKEWFPWHLFMFHCITLFFFFSLQAADLSHLFQSDLFASVSNQEGAQTETDHCHLQCWGLWPWVTNLHTQTPTYTHRLFAVLSETFPATHLRSERK